MVILNIKKHFLNIYLEIQKPEADHCELTAVGLVPNTITGLPPEAAVADSRRWRYPYGIEC